MPSLWLVVPVHGRLPLAAICLRQLRRTCDALIENGVEATAVVVADKDNLRELGRRLGTPRMLGFGTIERDNSFLSRRFNDGIQLACERPMPPKPREPTHGEYRVVGQRNYRGHQPGSTFEARLDRNAERRAIVRGDIRLLRRFAPSLQPGSWTFPSGWDPALAADFVIPCGSDDWIDWRILLELPASNQVMGFQRLSFVREDGAELKETFVDYPGGCGMRIYPRQVVARLGYRPADEDRIRGCDTSILTNLRVDHPNLPIVHVDTDPRSIVDWKSPGQQINAYDEVVHKWGRSKGVDPFVELAGVFPDESLRDMQAHYAKARRRPLVAA